MEFSVNKPAVIKFLAKIQFFSVHPFFSVVKLLFYFIDAVLLNHLGEVKLLNSHAFISTMHWQLKLFQTLHQDYSNMYVP